MFRIRGEDTITPSKQDSNFTIYNIKKDEKDKKPSISGGVNGNDLLTNRTVVCLFAQGSAPYFQ